MKTILKVYSNLCRVREAMERDAKEVNSSGMDFRLRYMDRTLEVTNLYKIIYKTSEDPIMSFYGLTVDEIYFDDLVYDHDRFWIEGIVKIRKNEETPKESEEFYYVVEDKVGSVTRIVRTNDKSFVETFFREN